MQDSPAFFPGLLPCYRLRLPPTCLPRLIPGQLTCLLSPTTRSVSASRWVPRHELHQERLWLASPPFPRPSARPRLLSSLSLVGTSASPVCFPGSGPSAPSTSSSADSLLPPPPGSTRSCSGSWAHAIAHAHLSVSGSVRRTSLRLRTPTSVGNHELSSTAQSQLTLESKLEALECHFTWDLDTSRSKLLRLRDNLVDIGTEEGYSWLGHIYNLRGYIQYKLGFTEDAQSLCSRAAEAFRQVKNTVSDEGPWLVVNYGNLAWLHHHKGEQTESRAYLSRIDSLMNEYPSPSQDELHPEIYAEKAWTLMKFDASKKLLAAEYFQKAIRMQPDMVEWHTSHVLALVSAFKNYSKELDDDILEKMRIAKEHDPENLYLAALYLEACAKKGKKVADEARELARRVLRKPVSSYSGIIPLLRLYRMHISTYEATDLAEGALERHPDERYLKYCVANCYIKRFFLDRDNPLEQSRTDRAISLLREVISLYPHSSIKIKTALANMYGRLNRQVEADQIFRELLESDLEPEEAQILYNYYAKYLHFGRQDSYRSIEYHMRAAEIPVQSPFRRNSIRTLEKIREGNRHPMCREVEQFLANLQNEEH
ncbi:interferon-induced protein with tetratricopeptide repeats 1-like [Symphorus nematophorus]